PRFESWPTDCISDPRGGHASAHGVRQVCKALQNDASRTSQNSDVFSKSWWRPACNLTTPVVLRRNPEMRRVTASLMLLLLAVALAPPPVLALVFSVFQAFLPFGVPSEPIPLLLTGIALLSLSELAPRRVS